MDRNDQPNDQPGNSQELPPKARRAICIIYITMGIMILFPLLLIWLTGAFRF